MHLYGIKTSSVAQNKQELQKRRRVWRDKKKRGGGGKEKKNAADKLCEYAEQILR